MIQALLPNYFKHRQKLLNSDCTKEQVNDFIRENDKFINFLTQYIETSKDMNRTFQSDNISLEKVVSTFRIDVAFNKLKARAWLLIALRMVISEGWTFSGSSFKKEGKVLLKPLIK